MRASKRPMRASKNCMKASKKYKMARMNTESSHEGLWHEKWSRFHINPKPGLRRGVEDHIICVQSWPLVNLSQPLVQLSRRPSLREGIRVRVRRPKEGQASLTIKCGFINSH
uniref:Uncharacterized protein n=1 Tax=Noccaea caerulescens TaxID=107243 RepID=A0A1J3JYQ9_NOCCA